MDELVQFLRARYDEDEQIARRAGGRSEHTWEADLSGKDPNGLPSWPIAVRYTTGGRLRGAVANLPIMQERSEDRMVHIARHDPARILRDIKARRQLVEVHHADLIEVVNADREERSDYWCAECDGEPFPCRTLRLLASVYADHPGYRAKWRP